MTLLKPDKKTKLAKICRGKKKAKVFKLLFFFLSDIFIMCLGGSASCTKPHVQACLLAHAVVDREQSLGKTLI